MSLPSTGGGFFGAGPGAGSKLNIHSVKFYE